jgi:hypothetical protein
MKFAVDKRKQCPERVLIATAPFFKQLRHRLRKGIHHDVTRLPRLANESQAT